MGGRSLNRVFRSDPAERDLRSIWRYIANDNPDAADRLLDRIQRKLDLLCESPGIGQPRDAFQAGLRSVAVGRYVLWYRQVDGGIDLLRVLHGAQQIGGTTFD